jgi:hypothetical protein
MDLMEHRMVIPANTSKDFSRALPTAEDEHSVDLENLSSD